jgi:hypothetical protein
MTRSAPAAGANPPSQSVATFEGGLIGRLATPVRFADQHEASRAEAAPQQLNSPGNAVPDPCRPDA